MSRVNVHELKAHLSKYLRDLTEGREEVVTVCNRNVAVAELRALPAPRKGPRPLGLAAGTFTVLPSFYDPLPDDLVRAFEGEEE